MENREPIIVVTGASSGIGNACATHLAKRGYKVYGTARKPSEYSKKADEFFDLIQMDATDEDSVAKAFEAVFKKEGRIDAVICNAGMGISGAVEDCELGEIALQMNTNFLGAVRAIKAVLPQFRAAKSGKIIVISSMGGAIGMPFQAFYSSSKFALEGLVESLRYEIRPFGLQACLIEPGDFRTGFTSARRVAARSAESPYAKYYDAVMGIQVRDENNGHDPLEIAKLAQRLIEKKHLKTRYSVGPSFERAALIIKRIIPSGFFELFFRKYYKLP